MNVNEMLTKLKELDKFKDWREKHADAKLVHLFMMVEGTTYTKVDIGFYDFETGLMSSFVVNVDVSEVLEISESKEIFTKDKSSIKPLDEQKIKISSDDVRVICKKLQQEKYKQYNPVKEIIILQKLDAGQVWNVTYMAQTFDTLNIKVDSETGDVLEDKIHKIFST